MNECMNERVSGTMQDRPQFIPLYTCHSDNGPGLPSHSLGWSCEVMHSAAELQESKSYPWAGTSRVSWGTTSPCNN